MSETKQDFYGDLIPPRRESEWESEVSKLPSKWRKEAETGRLSDTAHALDRCASELDVALLEDAAMRQGQAGVSAEQVREALQKLLDACLLADAHEELSGYVDGSLLDADAAKAALATAPPEQAAPLREEEVHNAYLLGLASQHPSQGGIPPYTPAVSAGALADAISYFKIEADARFGVINWRNKPHNEKWWKRIDGTPIPNDLVVCIAEEISKQLARALAAHDQKVRAEVCEAAAQVVKKWNFMACSDADGLIDAIRSLASGAEEKP